jgi:hypothetical protein
MKVIVQEDVYIAALPDLVDATAFCINRVENLANISY